MELPFTSTRFSTAAPELSLAKLEARALTKRFPAPDGQVVALDGVDLDIRDGEFVSVIGPSGCGKSTLLNLLAGLDAPTSGTIQLDGEPDPALLGRLGYMPQKDLLMPWRNILDNVILGLETMGTPANQARDAALDWFPLFGLEGFQRAYPSQLSGGMRQRAALLRTFLAGHEINLLDEPFGKLDSLTRIQLQQWLLDFCSTHRKTLLLITHDIEEAIFLSNRVHVMSPRPGRLVYSTDIPEALPSRYEEAVVDPRFVDIKHRLLEALRPGMEGGQ